MTETLSTGLPSKTGQHIVINCTLMHAEVEGKRVFHYALPEGLLNTQQTFYAEPRNGRDVQGLDGYQGLCAMLYDSPTTKGAFLLSLPSNPVGENYDRITIFEKDLLPHIWQPRNLSVVETDNLRKGFHKNINPFTPFIDDRPLWEDLKEEGFVWRLGSNSVYGLTWQGKAAMHRADKIYPTPPSPRITVKNVPSYKLPGGREWNNLSDVVIQLLVRELEPLEESLGDKISAALIGDVDRVETHLDSLVTALTRVQEARDKAIEQTAVTP